MLFLKQVSTLENSATILSVIEDVTCNLIMRACQSGLHSVALACHWLKGLNSERIGLFRYIKIQLDGEVVRTKTIESG